MKATIFYCNPLYSSESETLYNYDELGFQTSAEDARKAAREHVSEPKQGYSTIAEIIKIDFDFDQIDSDQNFESNICLFVEYLNRESHGVNFFEDVEGALIDWDFDSIETEYESIEDKLIIMYKHVKHMNYAHKIYDMRFGKHGETTENLHCNDDSTAAIWDSVTDITRDAWEKMNDAEKLELVYESISHLKYGGNTSENDLIRMISNVS